MLRKHNRVSMVSRWGFCLALTGIAGCAPSASVPGSGAAPSPAFEVALSRFRRVSCRLGLRPDLMYTTAQFAHYTLKVGTGGMFRRVNARRVAADDQAWFHTTIVADGPHVSEWVNGYQVTDWTDERKPDENPRKGLRGEPGTIMLQGHDPTTDVSFGGLCVAEMPKRATPEGR